MLFQALDDKRECVGVYHDGQIKYGEVPSGLTHTWGFSPHFYDKEIEYAQLYCGGKQLSEVCPEEWREDWEKISFRLRAFLRSLSEAQISLTDHCFFHLVPERFLLEFCELKTRIAESVFEKYPKPENYNFLVDVVAMTHELGHQTLNINKEALRSDLASTRARALWKKLPVLEPRVKYNPFGTKTGRLTTYKNSFPVLTLDKEFRSILKPRNDWFVELDYNAAELRTLLALSGKEQPVEDIHDWNIKNVFEEPTTREQAKKRVFSWLYNPEAEDALLDRAYDREAVLQKYFNGQEVTTACNRVIPSDDFHALNYIVQSTTSDIFLERAVKVWQYLRDKKSSISLLIHDSLLLDLCDDERSLLPEILNIFSNTSMGKYRVGVQAGKCCGEMKEVK